MAQDKTAAQLLQAQMDKSQRAQEKIDRDPEEAKAVLEPRTEVSDGGQVTMADMFGLFLQLQQQQASMQQQLVNLLTHQQQRETRTANLSKEELAAAEQQRLATLESWRTEPRDHVWIEPDLSDQKLAQSHEGEMPPRVYMVNGLAYAIPVGKIVEVPRSIAEQVRYTQDPKKARKKLAYDVHATPQAIASIADPARAQFLAGSQEVSAGYAGKTGEGRLVPGAVALSPEQAQPLDIRYDAFGR